MKCVHIFFVTLIAAELTLCMCNESDVDHEASTQKKTIILFGISGVGKSTISNCILNQKGDTDSIINSAFPVSPDASSGNTDFDIRSNDQYTIVDSIGFGSADINGTYLLDRMRAALMQVDNKVDYVVFVIQKGRLTNATFQFISTFQDRVLRNMSRNNSVLLINRCEQGWIEMDAQKNNIFLRQLLNSVNNVSYEFDLVFDHWSDDDATRARKSLVRKQTIDRLVTFLDGLNFTQTNLEHIQSGEFEESWSTIVYSLLQDVTTKIASILRRGKEFALREEEAAKALVSRFGSYLASKFTKYLKTYPNSNARYDFDFDPERL